MTCEFVRGKSGEVIAIVCSRGNLKDEMGELKKAMVCRKWEVCEKCVSYETCKNLLAKRNERK